MIHFYAIPDRLETALALIFLALPFLAAAAFIVFLSVQAVNVLVKHHRSGQALRRREWRIGAGEVGKTTKKRIVCCVLIILVLISIDFLWRSNRVIGTMHGPEDETIVLNNNEVYEISSDFHSNKRGWILGKIIGSYGTTYYVFSVYGDGSQKHIYVCSCGQGAFYLRSTNN